MASGGEFKTLNAGDRAGVIAMTLFATISATCVTLLLVHIFSIMAAPLLSNRKHDHSEERVFLRMQFGVFVVCLLFSDLCQAISGMIQGGWAAGSVVQQGPACSVQAVLLEFGDVGTAVWNAVVAIHTFVTVVLGKRMSKACVIAIVIGGWAIVGLFTLIGPLALATPERGPFYGVAAQWCFVREPYSLERVMVHYLPMFISAFIILMLYSMVFLTLRGNLSVEGWRWRFSFRARRSSTASNSQADRLRTLALKVLWYPVVYIALILPISVCRLATIDSKSTPIPTSAWAAAMCLLFSMGCANSMIYAFTRRIGPVPWFSRCPPQKIIQVFIDRVTHDDLEGCGTNSTKESKIKDFVLSANSSMRSTTKKSFTRKKKDSTRQQRKSASATTSDHSKPADVDLEVLNIGKPKPHFSADSTIAVMGSMLSSNPEPPPPHPGSISEEELDEKEERHHSADISESGVAWIRKEQSNQIDEDTDTSAHHYFPAQ